MTMGLRCISVNRSKPGRASRADGRPLLREQRREGRAHGVRQRACRITCAAADKGALDGARSARTFMDALAAEPGS